MRSWFPHIPLISEGCTLESSKALSLAATTCWPGWGRLAWISVVMLVVLTVEKRRAYKFNRHPHLWAKMVLLLLKYYSSSFICVNNTERACDIIGRPFLHISTYFCICTAILRGNKGKLYNKAYSTTMYLASYWAVVVTFYEPNCTSVERKRWLECRWTNQLVLP